MQKRYWIVPIIIAVILVASLLALGNTKSTSSRAKPTCCNKPVKKCQLIKEKEGTIQTSLDDLSNQFIVFPLFTY